MIKVLIAGTDFEISRSLNAYIKTAFSDFKVVGVVNDVSADLANTIRAKGADLVLADIRFFGITNFLKIRALYDRFPNLRFILYGGYSDAEYIQKAYEYGAISSLYRPIKPAELHRCLEDAIAYFKKSEEDKKRELTLLADYKSNKGLFENIFLKSLVNGQLKDETEIYYTFKYFEFDIKPQFTVFVIHIDHFKKIILAMDEMEKHILSYTILQIVERRLKGKSSKAFIEHFNSVGVILSGEYELDSLVEFCEEIKKDVHLETGHRVTVGIGRTYEKATDIHVSYREAKGSLLYRFHMGYNSVIHISFVEPVNNITYRYPYEREERLVRAVAIGEYEYAVIILREIFDALQAAAPLPNQYLSKVIMNILISINKNLSEQNIDIQNQFSHFFPSKDVFELGDGIEEAFQYLIRAMKTFCEHIVTYRRDHDKHILIAAKEYFAEKYYESVTLSKIATELGTTPEYINKLFIAHEGKNAYDYTVALRINAAKKYFRETKYDEDMVAVKVGYDDVRHFRSVFKKHENMSTTDYRLQFGMF